LRCDACQSDNPSTAKFCSECGARLPRLCPECQFPNAASAKFCNECGSALSESPASLPVAPPEITGAPIATPPTAPAIDGERRTVTVLFADMAGFTAMSERLDPEIVTEVINDCLRRAVAVVDQHGGSINKLTGDGLLALFGAPLAHEDDPTRALRAALEMQRELETAAIELEQRRGVHPRLRVGVNTGLVVAGIVGGAERSEYTVMGDVVNVAARIMACAEPGSVLVGDATRRLVEGRFQFRTLSPLAVKGKSEPLTVFELVSELAEPMAGLSGWQAPLIGRDEDLAQLEACYERARRGRPQVVSIVGEAGMGKTRLAAELVKLLAERAGQADGAVESPTIWRFTCRQEHRRSHELTCQVLRTALDLGLDDPSEVVRDRLESRASDLNTELAALETVVQLITVKAGGASTLDRLVVDPEQAKRRLFLLVQQLLARTMQHRPMVIVIDDANWIDEESREMLRFLIERVESLPLQIVFIERYGSGIMGAFHGRVATSSILLLPLSDDESERLLRAWLGRSFDVLPDDLRARILSRAGGNPLYLEALARSLIETDALRQEGGFWRLARQTAEVQVPDTIEGVIRARIDDLSVEERRLLQEAAVLGQSFGRDLLETYATAFQALGAVVGRLIAADLLIEDDKTVRFRHNLVRDVAYESLLLRAREELHSRAAESIQKLYADRLTDFVPALAEHYDRAGDSDRALPYLRAAADGATAMFAHAEAARLHGKVLELLRRRSADPLEQAAVCQLIAPAEAAHGNFDAALEHWRWAADEYQRSNETRTLADVRRAMGVAYFARGNLSEARESFGEALRLLDDLPHGPQHAELYQELARLAFHLGDSAGAADWARRALEITESVGAMRAACEAECTLGVALARQGDLLAGIETVEASLDKALDRNLPAVAGRAYINLAVLYSATDPNRASEVGARGLEMARRVGDAVCASWLHATLASSYHACSGDYDGALEHAERSIALDRQLGLRSHLPVPLIVLAQVQQCHGDMERAERNYLEALGLARELDDPQILFPCYDGLATLYLEQGDQHRAGEYMTLSQEVCVRAGISSDDMFATPFLY
jgi:adenylate cyclase